MKKKKLSLEEIRDAIMNANEVLPSELVEIMLAKNKKELYTILGMVAKRIEERRKDG